MGWVDINSINTKKKKKPVLYMKNCITSDYVAISLKKYYLFDTWLDWNCKANVN